MNATPRFDPARQRGDVSSHEGHSESVGLSGLLLQSAAVVGLAVGFAVLPVTLTTDGHGLLAQALAEDNDGGSEGGEDGGGDAGGGEDGGGDDSGGEDGGGEDGGGEDGGGEDGGGEDGGGEDGGGEDGGGEDGDGNHAGGEDEGGEGSDQESEDGEGATVIVPTPSSGW